MYTCIEENLVNSLQNISYVGVIDKVFNLIAIFTWLNVTATITDVLIFDAATI